MSAISGKTVSFKTPADATAAVKREQRSSPVRSVVNTADDKPRPPTILKNVVLSTTDGGPLPQLRPSGNHLVHYMGDRHLQPTDSIKPNRFFERDITAELNFPKKTADERRETSRVASSMSNTSESGYQTAGSQLDRGDRVEKDGKSAKKTASDDTSPTNASGGGVKPSDESQSGKKSTIDGDKRRQKSPKSTRSRSKELRAANASGPEPYDCSDRRRAAEELVLCQKALKDLRMRDIAVDQQISQSIINAVAQCGKVERLDLSENEKLRERNIIQILTATPCLTALTMCGNALVSLPPKIHEYLPRLRHIRLDHNRLDCLKGLSGCTKLQIVTAADNRLLTDKLFEHLSLSKAHLQVLLVSNNQLTQLTASVPSAHSSPRMGVRPATAIIGSSIRLFTALTNIELASNELSTLPAELFTLPNLNELIASNNRIDCIPNFKIKKPVKRTIKVVDLSDNLLTRLPEHVLEICDRLNCVNNRIKIIRGHTICRMPPYTNKQLQLKGNPLQYPPADAIPDVTVVITATVTTTVRAKSQRPVTAQNASSRNNSIERPAAGSGTRQTVTTSAPQMGHSCLRQVINFFREAAANLTQLRGMKVEVLGCEASGKSTVISSLADDQPRRADDAVGDGSREYIGEMHEVWFDVETDEEAARRRKARKEERSRRKMSQPKVERKRTMQQKDYAESEIKDKLKRGSKGHLSPSPDLDLDDISRTTTFTSSDYFHGSNDAFCDESDVIRQMMRVTMFELGCRQRYQSITSTLATVSMALTESGANAGNLTAQTNAKTSSSSQTEAQNNKVTSTLSKDASSTQATRLDEEGDADDFNLIRNDQATIVCVDLHQLEHRYSREKHLSTNNERNRTKSLHESNAFHDLIGQYVDDILAKKNSIVIQLVGTKCDKVLFPNGVQSVSASSGKTTDIIPLGTVIATAANSSRLSVLLQDIDDALARYVEERNAQLLDDIDAIARNAHIPAVQRDRLKRLRAIAETRRVVIVSPCLAFSAHAQHTIVTHHERQRLLPVSPSTEIHKGYGFHRLKKTVKYIVANEAIEDSDDDDEFDDQLSTNISPSATLDQNTSEDVSTPRRLTNASNSSNKKQKCRSLEQLRRYPMTITPSKSVKEQLSLQEPYSVIGQGEYGHTGPPLFQDNKIAIPALFAQVGDFLVDLADEMAIPVMPFDDFEYIIGKEFNIARYCKEVLGYLNDTGRLFWFEKCTLVTEQADDDKLQTTAGKVAESDRESETSMSQQSKNNSKGPKSSGAMKPAVNKAKQTPALCDFVFLRPEWLLDCLAVLCDTHPDEIDDHEKTDLSSKDANANPNDGPLSGLIAKVQHRMASSHSSTFALNDKTWQKLRSFGAIEPSLAKVFFPHPSSSKHDVDPACAANPVEAYKANRNLNFDQLLASICQGFRIGYQAYNNEMEAQYMISNNLHLLPTNSGQSIRLSPDKVDQDDLTAPSGHQPIQKGLEFTRRRSPESHAKPAKVDKYLLIPHFRTQRWSTALINGKTPSMSDESVVNSVTNHWQKLSEKLHLGIRFDFDSHPLEVSRCRRDNCEDIECTKRINTVSGHYPVGFVEQLIVMLRTIDSGTLEVCALWSGGIYARHRSGYFLRVQWIEPSLGAPHRRDDNGQKLPRPTRLLSLELRDLNDSELDVMSLWDRFWPVVSSTEGCLEDYRGLVVSRRTRCPACGDYSFHGAWLSPRETQSKEFLTCAQCGKDVSTDYLVQPKSTQRDACLRITQELSRRRQTDDDDDNGAHDDEPLDDEYSDKADSQLDAAVTGRRRTPSARVHFKLDGDEDDDDEDEAFDLVDESCDSGRRPGTGASAMSSISSVRPGMKLPKIRPRIASEQQQQQQTEGGQIRRISRMSSTSSSADTLVESSRNCSRVGLPGKRRLYKVRKVETIGVEPPTE